MCPSAEVEIQGESEVADSAVQRVVHQYAEDFGKRDGMHGWVVPDGNVVEDKGRVQDMGVNDKRRDAKHG